MKLLRLKLNEPFRSLPAGFEVHFLRDWEYGQMRDFAPYCLAGVNGSGKSNVLEVLAAIFYHLDCMNLFNIPDNFEADEEEGTVGFSVAKSVPDAFELEYLLPVKELDDVRVGWSKIEKKAGGAPKFWWKAQYNSDAEFKNLNDSPKEERKAKLPDFVIGYSSGENEVLSLPFFKMRFLHFDEYNDGLDDRKGFGYDLIKQPEGRLTYLDNQFSQAILICTMLFPNDKVSEIFREVIGVKALEEFRIIIRQRVDTGRLYNSLIENELEDEGKMKRHITQNLEGVQDREGIVEALRDCATCWHTEDDTLTLDYFVNQTTRDAFAHYFGDALTLFRRFQLLLTLNLYRVSDKAKKALYRSESLYANETVPVLASDERIMQFQEVFIQKEGVTEPILLKSLSDGEHQFMHTIGLCLLFRDNNALFLLDEPETHLNPDWRAKYVSTLRDCLEGSQGMQDILLTSHSPFVISDCQQEKVLVFEKIRDEKTGKFLSIYKRPDFKTFGASVNQITIKVFGKIGTIGDAAQDVIDELYARFETGEPADALIQESHRRLGDSVEKVIFINRLLDASKK